MLSYFDEKLLSMSSSIVMNVIPLKKNTIDTIGDMDSGSFFNHLVSHRLRRRSLPSLTFIGLCLSRVSRWPGGDNRKEAICLKYNR